MCAFNETDVIILFLIVVCVVLFQTWIKVLNNFKAVEESITACGILVNNAQSKGYRAFKSRLTMKVCLLLVAAIIYFQHLGFYGS